MGLLQLAISLFLLIQQLLDLGLQFANFILVGGVLLLE
jgi:hypothetical protein